MIFFVLDLILLEITGYSFVDKYNYMIRYIIKYNCI